MIIQVRESSQTGETRRRAVECAEVMQLEEGRCGAVALAATEMATNLVKHAGQGSMLIQQVREDGGSGVRLISVDKGPGIADMARALQDGHSTAGSMGAGLGAIRRVSDVFEVYSFSGAPGAGTLGSGALSGAALSGGAVGTGAAGSGTIVRAEFWQGKREHEVERKSIQTAVVSEPIEGQEACGDGWGIRRFAHSVVLMVVDGLGHGVLAAEAAREAERVLAATVNTSPQNILQDMHPALKKTRGAAVAIIRIEEEKGLATFAGVGNIAASIVSPGLSRSLASHNGTVGHQVPRIQEFTYPWNADSILVMHSDGLGTRWDLERYPGIWGKHPSMIAAILHRDFCRGRDDVTVLVAKTV